MDELLENIKSFWNSAELIYTTKDYTSTTILYFKCLFVLLDYIILKNKKIIPKDHSERFRILEKSFPEIYPILDKLFQIYRDTYSLKIKKDKCNEVKKNVAKIAEKQKIQLNNN